MSEPEQLRCCICGDDIEPENGWRFGHNAEPVAKGRCCSRCNHLIVVPERMKETEPTTINEPTE